MGLFAGVKRTIRNRPFMIVKYSRESLLYIANILLLKLFKARNVTIGKNPHILSPFTFQAELPDSAIVVGDDFIGWDRARIHSWGQGRVTIDHSCSFGSDTTIHCRERIEIGSHVLISWNVLIADFDSHSLQMAERVAEIEYTKSVLWPGFSGRERGSRPSFVPTFPTKPVIIEDGVWVGANAIVLKGSKIGKGSVIGAGSVVSGEIPPMCIAAGNPARVIKELK